MLCYGTASGTGGERESFSIDRWHMPKRDLVEGAGEAVGVLRSANCRGWRSATICAGSCRMWSGEFHLAERIRWPGRKNTMI